MRDAEAAIASREPAPAAAVAVAPPPPPVQSAPVKPFVEQLIFQADSLQAVSRNVETQMKREGIPVLAATREFVELASRPVAPSKPPTRSTLKRTPIAPAQFDDRRRDIDGDFDELLPPSKPTSRTAASNIPPVFDIAVPAPEVDRPVADTPFSAYQIDNDVIDDAPTPIPYDLSVAPFPGLAHHADDLPSAPIFDTGLISPLDPPAIVADHVFTDWSDAKNYHGNDHARPYDIDPAIEDDVFAYEAYVPPAQRGVSASPTVVATVEETGDVEATAEATQRTNAETAGIRNVAISHVLERITHHYRKRMQEVSPRTLHAHADAALEPDVAPKIVKPAVPGQIAHPYMVVVHDNLEIPKVPPYIWCAPELPWNCDEAVSVDSWFNCTGNRYQLAFDLDI